MGADMSETLVNLLQNSTLMYEWHKEMERIITQQIYSTKDTNIFMKAAVDPDILEQTYLQEIKEMEKEDKEGVENLNEDNNEWSSNQIKMKKRRRRRRSRRRRRTIR